MTVSEQLAVDAIQKQLEPILQETAETEAKLAELKRSKKRLEAALKALTGSSEGSSSRSRSPSRPCAKKADVFAVCRRLVEDNPAIPKDDLEQLAKQHLSEEKELSLSGFALRFGECLASGEFTVAADGTVRIADESERAANAPVDESVGAAG